jgi:hypothetical protein
VFLPSRAAAASFRRAWLPLIFIFFHGNHVLFYDFRRKNGAPGEGIHFPRKRWIRYVDALLHLSGRWQMLPVIFYGGEEQMISNNFPHVKLRRTIGRGFCGLYTLLKGTTVLRG